MSTKFDRNNLPKPNYLWKLKYTEPTIHEDEEATYCRHIDGVATKIRTTYWTFINQYGNIKVAGYKEPQANDKNNAANRTYFGDKELIMKIPRT